MLHVITPYPPFGWVWLPHVTSIPDLLSRNAQSAPSHDHSGCLLSEAYLLRRTDGSGSSRQGFMDALADDSDYAFVDYSINNVSAQQNGDIEEDGSSVISEPHPSLVTLVRVDGEWELASDAFFSR